jgi:molecular chaperone IbpA
MAEVNYLHQAFTRDPFFIGFDKLANRLLEAHSRTESGTYPPFNLRKESEDRFVIEMAVAGFALEDFDITVKDSVLTIVANPKQTEVEYVHKGIAQRAFTRSFSLAETVEVRDASLQDGILMIELENIIPEEKKPRKIEVKSTKQLLTENSCNP